MRLRAPCLLLIVLSLLTLVRGYQWQGFAVNCGQDIESHNVSSMAQIQGSNNSEVNDLIGAPGWTITVDEKQGLADTSIWYSTGGIDYSNTSIGFNACSWLVWDFPRSVLLKAVQDSGDCHTALSPACYAALNDGLTASALKWSKSPVTSNLTQLCENIRKDVSYNNTIAWPKECWDDFAYDNKEQPVGSDGFSPFNTSTDLFPLTRRPNQSINNCTVTNFNTETKQPVFDFIMDSSRASPAIATNDTYASLLHSMTLAIAVYVGEGDVRRNVSINPKAVKPWGTASLSCLVAYEFNNISRIVLPLSNSTSSNTSQSMSPDPAPGHSVLTGGEIIGLVLGVLCIIPAAVMLFLYVLGYSKRSQRKPDGEATRGPTASDGNQISELSSTTDKKELHSSTVVEMSHTPARLEAGSGLVHEMNPGEGWLVELPGDSAPIRPKRRVSV